MALKILSLVEKPDGSRKLDVCDPSDAMALPLRAYCPREPWNDGWKAGDVIDVDAREKTSAGGNKYLTLYPTAKVANEEPRTMADSDAIRVMSLSLRALITQEFTKINRKLNMALGIEETDDVPQPNFNP
jgi:hypothetical protein